MTVSHVLVGLGNPGARYENTPHNVGWEVVDALAAKWRCTSWRPWRRAAAVSEGRIRDVQVVLAKPTTFMNLSGEAVAPLAAHFEVEPARILAICDDIALPLGRIRLRGGGSSGGHRGLQSIMDMIDSAEFPRLRLGVAPGLEGLPCAAERWVLSKWIPERRAHMDQVIEQAVACAETFLADGLENAMNLFNGPLIEEPNGA
jgi:PTH1 family peptidyl-tRNA hydrolase